MKRNKFIWSIIILVGLYFFTRFINLTILPIFTDEAIYIRWGQIGLADAAHRFLSLEDGKQPLFIWLMYPMLKVFSDPLVAGRMVSVLAGFLSLTGIIAVTKVLFNKKASLFAGLLYVLSPYFLFYDRLALYDCLTTAFFIWGLFFQVLLVQKRRLDLALLLGFVIGGGLLTKSSAQFIIFLLPFSLLLFDFKAKPQKRHFLTWFGLSTISVILGIGFSFIIKLSPLAHMVGQKNLTFIISFTEFFAHPFSRLVGNLSGLTNWLIAYLTWPWVIAILISIIYGLKTCWQKTLLLCVWFSFPYFVLASFGQVLYPRFTLFMTPPLLVLLAYGLSSLKFKNILSYAICYMLFASLAIAFSAKLLINPINAPLPSADRFQFIDDWPAGYGIKEVIEFAKTQAQKESIFIATEGTFGLTPYALTIYLQDTPNLEIQGFWPISTYIEEQIIGQTQNITTYILFKDTQEPKPEWPLKLVTAYQKGRSNVYMKLYKVVNE